MGFISSIVDGVFGLGGLGLGSWLSSEAAEDAAYRQRDIAKELADYGYDLNVKSLLETPANARKGLVDAGFNPILAVNSAAGNPMSTNIPTGAGGQQAQIPQVRLDPLSAMAKAAQIDQTNAQTELVKRKTLGEGWQIKTLTAHEARGLGVNLVKVLGFNFNGSDSQTFLIAYNPITGELRNLANTDSLGTTGEQTSADAPSVTVDDGTEKIIHQYRNPHSDKPTHTFNLDNIHL